MDGGRRPGEPSGDCTVADLDRLADRHREQAADHLLAAERYALAADALAARAGARTLRDLPAGVLDDLLDDPASAGRDADADGGDVDPAVTPELVDVAGGPRSRRPAGRRGRRCRTCGPR